MAHDRKRTVLIIEDNEINREILCEILCHEYNTLQAENGKEGLDILKEQGNRISLVLLDIAMPVMNGYEFLENVRKIPKLSTIPIIVTTASGGTDDEILCLSKGASDFVTKPYNPDVVKMRVGGLIKLREASTMMHLVEFDRLTKVYSPEFFYKNATSIMQQYPDSEFDIICSDIECFKMVNDRRGRKKGDEILSYIANCFLKELKENEICGRIAGDIFACLVFHKNDSELKKFEETMHQYFSQDEAFNISVKLGVYRNVEKDATISSVCDKTLLALDRIKNHYGEFMSVYSDYHHKSLLKEQEILSSMENALREKQFKVYYQPKHDLNKDKTGGSEALVRWTHPSYGIMSPGEFIPIFERNGFISRLDMYICEQVCKDIHDWIQKGLPVVPVSMNISRVDFDMKDLVDTIIGSADKYEVPHELLHLEITESAYTDNPEQIKRTVNILREKGFYIELDDFGSGYSSLNMLDELPFDVLKLDMSVVKKIAISSEHRVVNWIFQLANQLHLETVAEGVESLAQSDKLKALGCTYAQGYYYSRPIPRDEFEKYILQN